MDHILKLQHSLDALFGSGTSKLLPKDIEITFSRKTGRIRTVSHKGKFLCTLRIDGSLAISTHFAQTLLKNKKFKENCVEVNADAAPGKNVRISADTPVLFKDKVIAVGRAILSSEMISDFERGVAIKVRDSLKSRNEEIKS
jgi:uncharacterized protein with predicted RNA binding PUA domain